MWQAGGFQPGGASKLNLIETEKRDWQKELPFLMYRLVSSLDTKVDLKTATVSLGH